MSRTDSHGPCIFPFLHPISTISFCSATAAEARDFHLRQYRYGASSDDQHTLGLLMPPLFWMHCVCIVCMLMYYGMVGKLYKFNNKAATRIQVDHKCESTCSSNIYTHLSNYTHIFSLRCRPYMIGTRSCSP